MPGMIRHTLVHCHSLYHVDIPADDVLLISLFVQGAIAFIVVDFTNYEPLYFSTL